MVIVVSAAVTGTPDVIGSVIVLALSIVLTAAAVVQVVRFVGRTWRATPATGVVVGRVRRLSWNSGSLWITLPVIRFTDREGRTWEGTPSPRPLSSSRSPDGTVVDIVYDAARPSRFCRPGTPARSLVLWLVVAVVVAVALLSAASPFLPAVGAGSRS